MINRTAETIRFDIFMAGDIAQAKQVCRDFCFSVGLCVTVEPVTFIYTGGEEAGECGFVPDACAANLCLRKKTHLAGLLPGSNWLACGRQQGVDFSSAKTYVAEIGLRVLVSSENGPSP